LKVEVFEILRRADEKLRVAKLLLEEKAWGDSASRAYYAVFHAISALHLSCGNTYSSLGQLIGRFNKDFVKTGVFPQHFTRVLTRLFEDRQSGDYDIAGSISKGDAIQDLIDAREIVRAVRAHLESTKEH
jgi:uncharacterized protein (UPF0332 family)